MSGRPSLVVLDQRRLIREGIAPLLTEAGYVVVGSYPTFRACVADIATFGLDFILVVGQLDDSTTPKSLRNMRTLPLSESLAQLSCAIDVAIGAQRKGLPTSRLRPASAQEYSIRERQILELISQGMSADQMAKTLGLSRSTVEHHKQQMFVRVGVQSQAHALAIARKARHYSAIA